MNYIAGITNLEDTTMEQGQWKKKVIQSVVAFCCGVSAWSTPIQVVTDGVTATESESDEVVRLPADLLGKFMKLTDSYMGRSFPRHLPKEHGNVLEWLEPLQSALALKHQADEAKKVAVAVAAKAPAVASDAPIAAESSAAPEPAKWSVGDEVVISSAKV